ncbi:unnamed protein product [Musa textilis]
MRPSSLLRTFSLKLISSKLSPSPVAPWPPVRTPFDRWIAAELDELRFPAFCRKTSAQWLSKALDLAVAALEMMARSVALAGPRLSAANRKLVEGYLEDVVDLLDACNGLRDRMDDIKEYTNLIATATHYLEGGHERGEGVIRRATAALAACEAMEKRCTDLKKCGSSLRKLGERIAAHGAPSCDETSTSAAADELHEALSGSRAVALLVVAATGIALSFRTRRGLPVVHSSKTAPWGAKLHELQKEVKEVFDARRRCGFVVLDELDAAASSARSLRDAISRRDRKELRIIVDLARRRCRESEERMRPLGEKVDELYRQLISIRVSLLGKLIET